MATKRVPRSKKTETRKAKEKAVEDKIASLIESITNKVYPHVLARVVGMTSNPAMLPHLGSPATWLGPVCHTATRATLEAVIGATRGKLIQVGK